LILESRFGESAPLSLGVEEELMIVDAATLAATDRAEELVAAVEGLGLPGQVKLELFASVIELATDVCDGAEEALAAMRELRRGVAETAAGLGLAIVAAGSHPVARPEEQRVARDERYEQFVRETGVTARRQGVSGLHVHVGMPSADACYRTLEGVLPWLPLVLALSANSPYLAGEETGLASNRAEILAQLPRAACPPAFGSYDGWRAFVERLVRLGVADDYTRIWWDARPHPRLGTLEVRMPDQPTAVAFSGAFAALVRALCATLLDGAEPPDADRGLYAQNRWSALRYGPRARLVDVAGERYLPVEQLAVELLELVTPAAAVLGEGELLRPIDPAACEGDRQLAVGHEAGLDAVCADLVARTLHL
jgi:carboxylate-amine ligase